MTDPTDPGDPTDAGDADRGDRAEEAIRRALGTVADAAPHDDLTVPGRRPRRTWLVLVGAAAAVVLAVAVPVALLGGDKERPAAVDDGQPAAGMRWVGLHDVEVQAPEDWGYARSPGRPDCLEPGGDPESLEGVVSDSYVEISGLEGMVTAQGCFPNPDTRGPAEFGEVPVALWQPHVELSPTDRGGPPDGTWQHEDWTLQVATEGSVRISVLFRESDDPGLGDHVLDSARRVDTDVNGCDTTSPVQAVEFTTPTSEPLPEEAVVGAVALCQYARSGVDQPALLGSRQLVGTEARSLVAAIASAPAEPGPDRPTMCVDDSYGDVALVLRTLDASGALVGEAYVYHDSCFGNGIFDSTGAHQLTVENCPPMFNTLPVSMVSISMPLQEPCLPAWQN